MSVTGFVHTGVVIDDLEAAVGFFETLGFACSDPNPISGEWVDRIIGLQGAENDVVMVRLPDGTDVLELIKFHAPTPEGDTGPAPANRLGIRHIAFTVDDVRATVERVRAGSWELVGDVVDYEGMFLLCYVRGPEGLIIELAERL